MKKIIALILAAIMLCAVPAALAEEEGRLDPLYATVGDALIGGAEGRIIAGGIPGDYYAVVTEKDGKYYRSVAPYDEKLTALEEAAYSLDPEADDYFDQFTAQPLSNEEMESWIGKTISELEEAGFEIFSSGTEGGEDDMYIAYTMRYGVFDYCCVVDVDFDSYMAAQENSAEGSLVVKGMACAGITEWGFEKRFHTDGTVEEPEDPMAAFSEILTEVMNLIQKVQAGEEVDVEGFANELKEKYPDYADTIDMYVTMYQTYGAEFLSTMLTPAE